MPLAPIVGAHEPWGGHSLGQDPVCCLLGSAYGFVVATTFVFRIAGALKSRIARQRSSGFDSMILS